MTDLVTGPATGTAAFDFLHGRREVHNRKLRHVTDPACGDWVEFAATNEVRPVQHGLGNVDQMEVPDPPDGPPFEGLSLRLCDPGTGTWRIWWSSTRAPGRLDPPVVGRFTDDRGLFECADVLAGRPVLVRFEWRADPRTPVWQQSFSFDDGATWTVNWVMSFSRPAGGGPAGADRVEGASRH